MKNPYTWHVLQQKYLKMHHISGKFINFARITPFSS